MKRLLLLFYFLLVQSASLMAMPADSLLRLLDSQTDNDKVYTLNYLAQAYKTESSSMSLEYAQKALILAQKLNDSKAIVESINNIGEYYLDDGNYAMAQQSFEQALRVAEKSDSLQKATVLAKIGVVHYFTNQYAAAFICQHKALKIFRASNSPKDEAEAISALGHILDKQGYQQKALSYYWEALKIRRELNMPNEIAKSLHSLGDFYMRQKAFQEALNYHIEGYNLSKKANSLKGMAIALNNMGVVYNYQGQYEEATSHLFESLAKKMTVGNKKEIAITLRNIADLYIHQKNYTEAFRYCDKALVIQRELGDKISLYKTYKLMGEAHRSQKKYTEAIAYFSKILGLAQTLKTPSLIKESYEMIYTTYLEQNKAEEFMQNYKYAQQYNDSLWLSLQMARIQEMQISYEQEDNLRKIESLKKIQESQQVALSGEITARNILFLGIIVTSVFGGLTFLFYRSKMVSNAQLEEQNNIRLPAKIN